VRFAAAGELLRPRAGARAAVTVSSVLEWLACVVLLRRRREEEARAAD
jgi:hypothetical protein